MHNVPTNKLPTIGSVLGFDFGLKRVGVAVGDMLLGVAHPHTVVYADSNEARMTAVAALIREWQPCALVVGEPSNEDGSAHELAPVARKFGNRMRENFKLPVTFVDEFLSSAEAGSKLAEQGVHGRAQKESIDAVAAQIILQSYFDDLKRTRDAA